MPSHICRCVTCSSCHTRYAMRSTPYPNGAYVAPDPGVADLFTLYCACSESYVFKLRELKTYVVSDSAYVRGYGSWDEIVPVRAAEGKAKGRKRRCGAVTNETKASL